MENLLRKAFEEGRGELAVRIGYWNEESRGVVENAMYNPSFGNFVAISHGNGIRTRYGHMQMLLVKPGQLVHRYEIIGYMGSTGMSTGSHLHYEVWVGDRPVNPVAYILPGDYSVD